MNALNGLIYYRERHTLRVYIDRKSLWATVKQRAATA